MGGRFLMWVGVYLIESGTQPSVIACGDERVLDAKPQFVAITTLSQNHWVILPAPFQGAYKSSVSLRKLAFVKKLISPLKGEVAESEASRRKGDVGCECPL